MILDELSANKHKVLYRYDIFEIIFQHDGSYSDNNLSISIKNHDLNVREYWIFESKVCIITNFSILFIAKIDNCGECDIRHYSEFYYCNKETAEYLISLDKYNFRSMTDYCDKTCEKITDNITFVDMLPRPNKR